MNYEDYSYELFIEKEKKVCISLFVAVVGLAFTILGFTERYIPLVVIGCVLDLIGIIIFWIVGDESKYI